MENMEKLRGLAEKFLLMRQNLTPGTITSDNGDWWDQWQPTARPGPPKWPLSSTYFLTQMGKFHIFLSELDLGDEVMVRGVEW
jgi:hypothetical protein